MMDVITGKTRPDEGIVFFGQTIDLLELSEPEIAQGGIGRKFQKPTVFEQHSGVRESGTGHGMPTSASGRRCSPRLTGEQRDRIDEVLEIIGLTARAHAPRRPTVARPEAMAGDRHAADAEPARAAGR